ncbi:MAG: type III-B CRISPR module-associated protein Cmr5 [Candidatus Freyarchaeota archaeon]
MLRSLEQERANFAWDCVEKLKASKRREEDQQSGIFNKIKERMNKAGQRSSNESLEEKLRKYYESLEEKYSSYVKKAPTLIQVNGLGNSLAFYKSKFGSELEEKLSPDGRAYKLLYGHLDQWFRKHFKKDQDITEWIIADNTSSIEVFHATREIIGLLSWLKRFAEAELKGEESE